MRRRFRKVRRFKPNLRRARGFRRYARASMWRNRFGEPVPKSEIIWSGPIGDLLRR